MPTNLSSYSKFFAAAAGVIGQVIAANLVTGTALHYAQVVLAIVTALSVYVVPNGGVAPAK